MKSRDKFDIQSLGSGADKKVFDQCGQLHADIISGGFLTRLGPSFLSAFYSSLAAMPQSFLLVAICNGAVVGLIAGSTDSKRLMRRFILTRAWRFAPHLLQIVLRREYLKKIFELIVYPSKQEFEDLPEAEIINFCISSDIQGQGLGRTLFEALVKEFESRNIGDIRIVTGASQISAQHFYRAVGARQIGDTTIHEGDHSLVFVYQTNISDNVSS